MHKLARVQAILKVHETTRILHTIHCTAPPDIRKHSPRTKLDAGLHKNSTTAAHSSNSMKRSAGTSPTRERMYSSSSTPSARACSSHMWRRLSLHIGPGQPAFTRSQA